MKRFFLATEVPWSLALLRIGVSLVVLADLVPRFPHALELYSTIGLPMPFALWNDAGPFLPALAPEWTVTLHAAAIFLALAVLVGWQTRLAVVSLFGLYFYFALLDLPGSMSKYGLLAAHVLLLLVPSQCGAVLSVDALGRRRDGDEGLPKVPVWPRRLIQLLVVSLYLGAAVTKLRIPGVINGDWMVQSLLNEDAGRHPLGQLLAFSAPAVLLLSYATLFFQILFPFLVWVRKIRYWVLGAGALFHLAHGPTLNIWIFPAIVIVCYVAFVEEEDLRRFVAWLGRAPGDGGQRDAPSPERRGRRTWVLRPGTSAIAFVVALILFDVAAGAVHRKLGPCTALMEGHPPALPPLPESDRARFFQETALEPQDQFLFVDVGSWANENRLLDSRRRFRVGEELVAYAELLEPHAPVHFTWRLRESDGKVLAEQRRLVVAYVSRDLCRFPIDADMPGRALEIELRCGGREVFRRPIDITD
jgi:hypothetical protein